MADIRILNATDISALNADDALPVERPADATPYKATLAEVLAFIHALSMSIPAITGAAKWHYEVRESVFNGHKDQVAAIGYNPNGVDDANETDFLIGFETDYWTDAVNHVAEWYIEWAEKYADAHTFRPIHVLIDRVGFTVHTVLNGTVSFSNHDSIAHSQTTGAGEWTYKGDGTYDANKGPVIRSPDGTKYRIKVANGGALSTEVAA